MLEPAMLFGLGSHHEEVLHVFAWARVGDIGSATAHVMASQDLRPEVSNAGI